MDDMGKDATINVRCPEAIKARVVSAAEQLGYPDMSSFVVDTLMTVTDAAEAHGWECRRVTVDPESLSIVACGSAELEKMTSDVSFLLVGPKRFWSLVDARLERREAS